MPARARARILIRAAALPADRIGEYARMETQQIGRPLREMRAQLARLPEWLEYFGVSLAQELDLGTLCAIKKWIDEGRAPPLHTNSPDDPATTPP